MPHRFLSARARSALLTGTLAPALVVATALPAFVEIPSIAQAGPRKSASQSVSAERKKGRHKQRNVTRSFESDAAVAIPDPRLVNETGQADPYPSRVVVEGIRQGRVLDINLTLRGFTHAFPADVDLLLVAPNGVNALVMADVGNPAGDEAVSDLTITLDDEAAEPLPVDALLTSGTFRPTDGDFPGPDGATEAFPAPAPTPSGATTLATFDGIDPNGEWQLFILDDDIQDAGEISRGWSLEITANTTTKTTAHHKKGKH